VEKAGAVGREFVTVLPFRKQWVMTAMGTYFVVNDSTRCLNQPSYPSASIDW